MCNCGPPVPVTPAASPTSSTSKSSSNTGVIAGVVGGILGVIVVGVLIGILICCCVRKRKAKADKFTELPTHQYSTGSGGTNGAAVMVDAGSVQGAKPYSLAEITAATQNFNKKIGEGGFGPVYYGKLAGGREVAVKVSDANSRQGVNEFNNEVPAAPLLFLCSPVFYFFILIQERESKASCYENCQHCSYQGFTHVTGHNIV